MKTTLLRRMAALSLTVMTLTGFSSGTVVSAAGRTAPSAVTAAAVAAPYLFAANQDGTLTITQYTGHDAAVRIPSTINGKQVTAIGASAFVNCTTVKSLFLPKSVRTVSGTAFVGCHDLTAFQVESGHAYYTVADGVLFNKSRSTLVAYPGGKTGAYTVPNTVTLIDSHAFSECNTLTAVTIPTSVKTIGFNAFALCKGLTKVTLNEGLTTIKTGAFNGCSKVTLVTLPKSLTTLESYAFSFCRSLKSMAIPSKITSLPFSLFEGCTALRYVQIPSGVKKVYSNAFRNCVSLTSVRLPKAVTNIYGLAFCGCHQLTNLTILSTTAQMQPIAFDDCPNLTIYGKKGSTAEAAAKAAGIPFSTQTAPAQSLSTVTAAKKTVTVKAKAIDGTGPYRFAVYYLAPNSKVWREVQDYSTNNTISFAATRSGTYQVVIRIKDAANRITQTNTAVDVK